MQPRATGAVRTGRTVQLIDGDRVSIGTAQQ
jgi:hypothetical protein